MAISEAGFKCKGQGSLHIKKTLLSLQEEIQRK